MHASDEHVIVILVVGALAGFLASKVIRGAGLGLVGDGAIGIVGAMLGDWLLPRFHFHFGGGLIGIAITAAIGAIVALIVIRVSGASGSGGRH